MTNKVLDFEQRKDKILLKRMTEGLERLGHDHAELLRYTTALQMLTTSLMRNLLNPDNLSDKELFEKLKECYKNYSELTKMAPDEFILFYAKTLNELKELKDK